MRKEKIKNAYEMFPYSVQIRTTEENWKNYKELCNQRGENAHGNLRKFMRKYMKKYGKDNN
jgi:hypothetical protein